MQIHDHVAALKTDIENAFAKVQYPGDEKINSEHCLECRNCASYLRGKHWKELNPDGLKEEWLSLLEPEVFQFYLPAFLITTLHAHYYQDHISETVPNITGAILYVLAHPEDRMRGFERTQNDVLRKYLIFIRDEAYGYSQDDARIDTALALLGEKAVDEKK